MVKIKGIRDRGGQGSGRAKMGRVVEWREMAPIAPDPGPPAR